MSVQEIVISLKQIAAECEKVTSGNISHRIANIRHSILNLADYFENYYSFDWHSVDKELPKEKQKVLVYMPADERCDHEYMCEALYNYAWHKWEDADEPIELEGITHWREITPPRKEEKK